MKYRVKQTAKVTRWIIVEAAESPKEALDLVDKGDFTISRNDRHDESYHDIKRETLQVHTDSGWEDVVKPKDETDGEPV